MTTRKCKSCNETKPIELFTINFKVGSNNYRKGKDPYSIHCKKCSAVKAKAYRDSRPGLWKKYVGKNKGKGKINKYPEEDHLLISAIRARISNAKTHTKRNTEKAFNIDTDYCYQIYKEQNGKCNLTRAILLTEISHPLTLSLDKIDSEKGYVKGNIQWLAWAVNRAKGDLKTSDFINMCKSVVKKCNDYPERE